MLNEVLSLPSGFLQAGAEGVIGSLWRVADVSTMMLMSRFYDFWLDEGMEPHQALRAAQQWVRDSTNGEKALHFKKRLCLNTESMTAFLRQLEDRDPNARDFDHPFYLGGILLHRRLGYVPALPLKQPHPAIGGWTDGRPTVRRQSMLQKKVYIVQQQALIVEIGVAEPAEVDC